MNIKSIIFYSIKRNGTATAKKVVKVGRYDYRVYIESGYPDRWDLYFETNPFLKDSDRQKEKYNLLPIIFVHQLQNLYFALTNEELTWR